jgi:predicted ATP-dependent protease
MKLSADQLRRTYDPQALPTADGRPGKAIIGQERAVKALQFGLGYKGRGFNIYVSGVPGTGKQTAVKHYLKERCKQAPTPSDWCYVNNFNDPYQPHYLELNAGTARAFRNDVHQFVLNARSNLIKVFESESYVKKREALINQLREDETAILEALGTKAFDQNFTIQRTPMEIIAVPRVGDRAMTDEEFMALPVARQDNIIKKQEELKAELRQAARDMRAKEHKTDQLLFEIERDTASAALRELQEELLAKYDKQEAVIRFWETLQADIVENLQGFLQFKPDNKPDNAAQQTKNSVNIPSRYEVNVLVDNTNTEGAPITLELNPTYGNLFGKIEKESVMGSWVTDFTLIRGGALHNSNGGYLILPAAEVLRNMFSWDGLKRALRNNEIAIEEPGEQLGFLTTKSLKPKPIPLRVQIILLGSPLLYMLLYEYDEDFKELFKVKADFDTTMAATEETLSDFCIFMHSVCQEEQLLPLSPDGLAKLLEFSHRKAEDQAKLSIRFGEIIDLIQEASHYATEARSQHINAVHLRQAISERLYRANLLEEKIQEMIRDRIILIDLQDTQAGQVNGISIINMGDIEFGRPNRITAGAHAGSSGILDIEREAKLGGPIHTKGVMILSGYLASVFGQHQAINLSAQLVFEQSYSEIEGDSASSAELYALLSALSGVPIRQHIAVTGSVNQKGEVQAVGGINEKIEGFFEVCRASGLTGEQGVVIPESNIRNLMLKEEVVEAVQAGRFHIWAVRTIEEGIEILTGVPAGHLTNASVKRFEKGSVFDLVNKRLQEYAAILHETRLPNLMARRSFPAHKT